MVELVMGVLGTSAISFLCIIVFIIYCIAWRQRKHLFFFLPWLSEMSFEIAKQKN